MIYLLIALMLLLLSFRYDICGKKKNRTLWYDVVLVILILVAGLRWRLGTDTPGSLETFYARTPLLWDISYEGTMVKYPLWGLLNSIVLTCGGRFFVVQLIQSTWLNVLLFKYIRKHTNYIFTCVLIYYLWLYTSLNMEEMKAGMAIPLCLYANDFFLKRKWIKGYLLLLIACMFHFSVFVLLIIPLLYFLRLNKTGIFILIFMFFIGFFIKSLFGDYIMLLEFSEEIFDKAETYTNSEKFSLGMGIYRAIILVVPIIVYTLFSTSYIKKNKKNICSISYEPCILIALCFLILQINVYVFYRYFHFYAIYCVLIITQASVDNIRNNSKKFSLPLSYVRTIFLFLPFLFSVIWPYKGKYYRYYPYYSVIERKIDKIREQKQSEYRPNRAPVIYKWY